MSRTSKKQNTVKVPKADEVHQKYPKLVLQPTEDTHVNIKWFGMVVDKTTSIETKFDVGNGWYKDTTVSNMYRYIFGFIKYLKSYRSNTYVYKDHV